MAAAVVFAFAVDDGLVPVAGAAPWDVLARQLPRLLVARLNGNGDRGARFFPFLGPIGGQRAFLCPHELFEPATLAQVHKQGDVALLLDGILRAERLHCRLVDGRTTQVMRTLDVPFDPRRPLDVLARLQFEVAGMLGLPGRPTPPLALQGEALGWYLVLRDELLRREASLRDASPDPLRAARRCVELAPHDADVQDVATDFAALLLRAGERRDECARVLATFVHAKGRDAAWFERLDALLLAAGDDANAAIAARAAALADPARAELVERAAAQAFRLGRYADAREVIEVARARGVASVAALAQLAAVCDRTGDQTTRAELVRELVGATGLTPPVARLVVSFLLEDGDAALARTIAERTLATAPDQPMLHFESGRASLLLDDGDRAAPSLRRALQLGLPPAVATQAQRLLRLARAPGLLAGTQQIETAIAAGDLGGAHAAARALVKRVGPIAEAWYLLGVVSHKLGRSRAAERVLRRAIRHGPDAPEPHNRLGILLVASGRVADGHALLQRAHQLAPADPSPLLHLAQACALLGRAGEAEAHVAAAERCGADPQLVHAVRAEILAKPA